MEARRSGRWSRFAVYWALLILALCLLPKSSVPEPGFLDRIHFDKLVHAFLFGVLHCLVLKAVYGSGRTLRSHLMIGAMVILYGGTIELLQEALDLGRNGDLADLAADAGGVILATALLRRAEVRRSVPYNS